MDLLEYEAKRILSNFNAPVPKSTIYRGGAILPKAPVVLKSQVHTGGRGKAGGVIIIKNQNDMEYTLTDILRLEIKGEKPKTILAEEILNIKKEFYLSVIINRNTSEIEIMAGINGGVDIEDNKLDNFFKKPLTVKNSSELSLQLAEYYDISEQSFALQDLIDNLYRCFINNDCLLLEINPLILTRDNKLVAGDCKMTLDAAANFRHPNWDFEQPPKSANFVTLNSKGSVATIANGAGLAMATVDAVKKAGFTPANFLDVGGGATVEGLINSFELITKFKSVNAIIINIFGGIVRCDDISQAIIIARQKFKDLPKLYIRLSGNRSDEAKLLLANENIKLYADLPSCIKDLK